MDFEFTEEQKKLIARADELVRERIAPRAAKYDREIETPVEDIQDLHREGWLLANLDRGYGGLGYGLDGDDPLAFFLLVEHLARGNSSTAHCFQVHNNTLMMISAMATAEQRERWLKPTVERGALLPGSGSEPHGATPTTAQRVDSGFVVNGMKHYATNAELAEWFWVGGVSFEGQPRALMLMVHRDTPGLKIDFSAWRPMGMKACVSPWLYFENCFVPEGDRLGEPGEFRKGNWLAKINFAFTANYLGSAQAMYDWALNYVRERSGGKDPYKQLRAGELKSFLDASRLLLYNAVMTFKRDSEKAMVMAHEAKWMAKEMLRKVMWGVGEMAGSTSLFEKHPLERFYRDMHVHMLHGVQDVSAQIVGAAELGEPYDVNRAR
jgi:alkylation response protein AidB-like acyl-CoA dehydrogenase